MARKGKKVSEPVVCGCYGNPGHWLGHRVRKSFGTGAFGYAGIVIAITRLGENMYGYGTSEVRVRWENGSEETISTDSIEKVPG